MIKPLHFPDYPFPDYTQPELSFPARMIFFYQLKNMILWSPENGVLIDDKPPAEWLAHWINKRCQISPAIQPGNKKRR